MIHVAAAENVQWAILLLHVYFVTEKVSKVCDICSLCYLGHLGHNLGVVHGQPCLACLPLYHTICMQYPLTTESRICQKCVSHDLANCTFPAMRAKDNSVSYYFVKTCT